MARGYSTRKLEVWSIHAHQDGGEVDYTALFRDLGKVRATERIWRAEDRLIAVPILDFRDSKVWSIAYEGPTDEQPIILDVARAVERDTPLDPGEIVATKTHALIDLASREAIIEYVQRGAKAGDIAAVLGQTARRLSQWRGVWIELAPKVEAGFVEAIDDFERIRVASMKLVRPNTDWDEWRETLSDVADESNAQNVAADFAAGRGQSLERNQGIVRFIKDRATDLISGLKSAAVVGSRAGEGAETRVSTTDHKTHQRVSVRLNERGQVDDADIEKRIADYDQSRMSVQRSSDRPGHDSRRRDDSR